MSFHSNNWFMCWHITLPHSRDIPSSHLVQSKKRQVLFIQKSIKYWVILMVTFQKTLSSICLPIFFNQSKQRAGFIQSPHCWSQQLSDARYHWWKYFFIRPHWHLWRKTLNKNPCMRAVCDGLSRDIQSYKTLQAASYKLKDQRKIKNAYWMS